MRIFTIIWFGQLISTLGSELTGFALGVWIYLETGSTTLFALSFLIFSLPGIVLGPLVGWVSDRYDRRLVMILSDSLGSLGTLFVGLMYFNGNLQIWHIYLAQFLFSVAGTFQWPAYQAAISLMVPKKHLGRAAGMSQIGQSVSTLAAPIIAGTLYVSVGLQVIILIDIATYLFAITTLLAVRFPQPKVEDGEKESESSFIKEAIYGWKYLRASVGLFGLLMATVFANFLSSLTWPLLTPLMLNLGTPDVVGYAQSFFGVGALAGALIMSVWGGPKRKIKGLYFGWVMYGIALMLIGLSRSIWLVGITEGMVFLGLAIMRGCGQAIWQSKVAQNVQGRVFAIRQMFASISTPVASLLAGPVSEKLFEPWMASGGVLETTLAGKVLGVGPGRGIGMIFFLSGILYIGIGMFTVFNPRIRRVEIELPDAV